jgi:hypothetical protein
MLSRAKEMVFKPSAEETLGSKGPDAARRGESASSAIAAWGEKQLEAVYARR